jgi:hypothetical protein
MEFIKPSIEKSEEILKLMKRNKYRCCDFSAGTLILWGEYYGYMYTVIRDFFVIRMSNFKAFSFPMYVGSDNLGTEELKLRQDEVIEELMNFFDEHGEQPRFALLSIEQSERLEELYPGVFDFSDNEDYRDYIYNTEDLAELAGRHYHGKRNHIYRFEENYTGYKAEDITDDNIESCKSVEEAWTDDKSEELLYEKKTIFFALDHMKELGLEGCVIRIPEEDSPSGFRTAAFAIGERLTDDCFVVHFEKADPEIRGAYVVINRDFARKLKGRFRYINREEDMGLEGLRKAKMSYHPVMMYRKLVATRKDSV